jgi:sodium transport system permease protein
MVLASENSALQQTIEANPKLKIIPPSADYKDRIVDRTLRAAVEIPPGFESALAADKKPRVALYHYAGEMKSRYAAAELRRTIDAFQVQFAEEKLKARGLNPALLHPIALVHENVAPPEKVGGAAIGGFIPYLLIILCFTGAMYTAADLTAGEKERGTMETILCSPVARLDIVLGKFLRVLTASLGTVLCSMISFTLTGVVGALIFMSKAPGLAQTAAAGRAAARMGLAVDPLGVALVFVLVIPIAVLFAALLFTVALFAKSYKEAQSYLAPLVGVAILPAVAAVIPGIELNAKLALVPILNVALVSKELVSGNYPVVPLLLIFLSTCVYATAALALAVRMFNREDVIFRT